MADDAFGLKSPNNPKAYTPPAGLEAVHREGNTWAIQGDRTENTSHIEVNQWNYMIALWRGLTFVEGVDLSDLNSGDPMLLKEIVVRSIDAVGGPYLTGAAAAASTATTKAGEAADSADIAVGAAGTATTKAGEAAGSAGTAAGAAGTATTKAAEALASANAAGTARAAAESARDATLAAFDEFDDTYLGAFAVAPTTDNDGDPLQPGALYFDTVAESMKLWTGSAWVAAYVSAEGVPLLANNGSDYNTAVFRANIGLNNVNNTSDADKPVSTAQAAALAGKASSGHSHSAATSAAPGFMAAEDKAKLDAIEDYGAADVGDGDDDETPLAPTEAALMAAAKKWGAPSYALILDRKASGASGGTFTAGAWQKRDLNHIRHDPGGIVSGLLSGEFTLIPGKYEIALFAPAYRVNNHQIRLYDVTNGVMVEGEGSSEFVTNGAAGSSTKSNAFVHVDISEATTYRVEHRCEVSNSSIGFGLSTGFGGWEVYTQVHIEKMG